MQRKKQGIIYEKHKIKMKIKHIATNEWITSEELLKKMEMKK